VPSMLPAQTRKPNFVIAIISMVVVIAAGVALALLSSLPALAGLAVPGGRSLLWVLLVLGVLGTLAGFSAWFKAHAVAATVIASSFVVVGMWLERWNIVIPTTTHAMLIPYGTYTPSLTEISITAASVAGFVLMFIVFFKLFPAISIWEIAEGRVVEQAQSVVVIPQPEVSPAQGGD